MKDVIVVNGVSVGPGWTVDPGTEELISLEGVLLLRFGLTLDWDEEVTAVPEEGNALDGTMDPELISESEELGVELAKTPELDAELCVSVAVAVIDTWLETGAVELGPSQGVLSVTTVEVVIELPEGITGREDEGFCVPDCVETDSLTGREVL